MKVVKRIKITTDSEKEVFTFDEIHGHEAAYAYHINAGNKGFGKFIIDDKTL